MVCIKIKRNCTVTNTISFMGPEHELRLGYAILDPKIYFPT